MSNYSNAQSSSVNIKHASTQTERTVHASSEKVIVPRVYQPATEGRITKGRGTSTRRTTKKSKAQHLQLFEVTDTNISSWTPGEQWKKPRKSGP